MQVFQIMQDYATEEPFEFSAVNSIKNLHPWVVKHLAEVYCWILEPTTEWWSETDEALSSLVIRVHRESIPLHGSIQWSQQLVLDGHGGHLQKSHQKVLEMVVSSEMMPSETKPTKQFPGYGFLVGLFITLFLNKLALYQGCIEMGNLMQQAKNRKYTMGRNRLPSTPSLK